MWRQHNDWSWAAQPTDLFQSVPPVPVPLPGSYLVVRGLVVFSLCGQASLSHYCTHADAAAKSAHPPPPAPAPLSAAAPTMERGKSRFQFKHCHVTVSNQRNKSSLLLSPLLNIRLKFELSRNYPSSSPTTTATAPSIRPNHPVSLD